jgi:asparagine synthase (glutamine-hydrolysing)
MCGFLLTNLDVKPHTFQDAFVTLAHRGPDQSSGVFNLDAFTGGHYRLSIIGDSINGKQPMVSEEEGLVILFNGEIYNFLALAKQYNILLRSQTDTELILKLYRLLGESLVNHLDGMFSFVIIDRKFNRIFYARDRLGAKPLYQWQRGDKFVLASEVRAISELVNDTELDQFAVRQYRTMRSTFGGRTFYKNIRLFPPGCWSDGKQITRYWGLVQKFDSPPSVGELHNLVASAINHRMVADVEIGAFLSGGLDSTIATLISGVKKTWAVGFEGDEDLPFAADIARQFALQHKEVIINKPSFLSTATEMILARKEPLCVPNEVLIYLMARDVRDQGVKCVLSGEGADELFGGYDRIFSWSWSATDFDLRAFALLYCYGEIDMEVIEDALSPYLTHITPYLIVSAFFQVEHLGALLRRLDHATMLAGIEAREPFADFQLVERLFGLPYTWKYGALSAKTPFKRAFLDAVPVNILNRKKNGFPVPLSSIFLDTKGLKAGYPAWFDFNLKTLGWLT